MNICQYTTAITALACAIYQNTSADESAFLAAVFSQLGDTLETIAAGNELCSKINGKNF